MALTTVPLPYGLRDIKVTPYTTAAYTTLGTPAVDFPNARTLSFSDAEEFEELRGDDRVVATHGNGASVEWEMEGGGFSFEACKVMYGGTITETGTTPAQVKKFVKLQTDTRMPFKLEGQIISDSGGDVHCVLDACKSTGNMEGEFGDGQFYLTGAQGIALPSKLASRTDYLYEFVQNETAVAIA